MAVDVMPADFEFAYRLSVLMLVRYVFVVGIHTVVVAIAAAVAAAVGIVDGSQRWDYVAVRCVAAVVVVVWIEIARQGVVVVVVVELELDLLAKPEL